jgi:hypothetical protein
VNDQEDGRLIVYGYVHRAKADEVGLASDRKEITRYCRSRGYHLVTIFCDRKAPDNELLRAGFVGLLDALSLPDSYGVVVTEQSALSSQAPVRQTMMSMVDWTAATVIDMARESA